LAGSLVIQGLLNCMKFLKRVIEEGIGGAQKRGIAPRWGVR